LNTPRQALRAEILDPVRFGLGCQRSQPSKQIVVAFFAVIHDGYKIFVWYKKGTTENSRPGTMSLFLSIQFIAIIPQNDQTGAR